MKFKGSWLAISLAVVALGGCGGGGGGADSLVPSNQGGVTRIVAFGDSLSDPGAYALPAAEKGGGRFTVNGPDSKVWTELVARDYGISLVPNQIVTDVGPSINPAGTSYAEGGARVTVVYNKATGAPISALERNLKAPFFVAPIGRGLKIDTTPCALNGQTIFSVANNAFGNTYATRLNDLVALLAGCVINHSGTAEATTDAIFPLEYAGTSYFISKDTAILELETGAEKKLTEIRNATRTGFTTLPISVQVSRFLDNPPTEAQKKNTLILIQGGANDFFALASAITEGSFDASDGASVNGFVVGTATDLATQIIRLQNAGYEKIVYGDLPNVGDTPFGRSLTQMNPGLGSQLNPLTAGFNAALEGALTQLGRDQDKVKKASMNELFSDIVAQNATNPAYGFKVLSDGFACKTTAKISPQRYPLRTTNSSLFCNGTNSDDLNSTTLNPFEDFVFADGVHPSPKVHRLYAEKVLNALRVANWR